MGGKDVMGKEKGLGGWFAGWLVVLLWVAGCLVGRHGQLSADGPRARGPPRRGENAQREVIPSGESVGGWGVGRTPHAPAEAPPWLLLAAADAELP